MVCSQVLSFKIVLLTHVAVDMTHDEGDDQGERLINEGIYLSRIILVRGRDQANLPCRVQDVEEEQPVLV